MKINRNINSGELLDAEQLAKVTGGTGAGDNANVNGCSCSDNKGTNCSCTDTNTPCSIVIGGPGDQLINTMCS